MRRSQTLPRRRKTWFDLRLNEDRPLFAFAGMWTIFNGDRGTKSRPIPGPHQIYGFLTTALNDIVAPIQPKAIAGDPHDRRGARRLAP
jgi:putative SOS response-associated peptidase YedK